MQLVSDIIPWLSDSVSHWLPSCYEELRNSKVLLLPSQGWLRHYRNAIQPQRGFQDEVVKVLQSETESYFDVQRYVVLLFDEMKIMANLVLYKVTGKFIGFTDLGDPYLNFGSWTRFMRLPHMHLAFLVRRVLYHSKLWDHLHAVKPRLCWTWLPRIHRSGMKTATTTKTK